MFDAQSVLVKLYINANLVFDLTSFDKRFQALKSSYTEQCKSKASQFTLDLKGVASLDALVGSTTVPITSIQTVNTCGPADSMGTAAQVRQSSEKREEER